MAALGDLGSGLQSTAHKADTSTTPLSLDRHSPSPDPRGVSSTDNAEDQVFPSGRSVLPHDKAAWPP